MSDANRPLRIMTFNIASGLTLDDQLDVELTASVIENADVDIAGLQEVEQNFSERTDFTDQVKWLAKRLNMNIAFGPNVAADSIDNGDAEASVEGNWPEEAYGNAILSRYPLKSYQNHMLKKIDSGGKTEQRGLLEAVIEIDDKPIAFFSTHLSLKEKQLAHNIDELLRLIRKKDVPVILTGDFNADPDNPHMMRIEMELNSVFGASAAHPVTYKKDGDHGKKIDFIFCSEHWRVLNAETIETEASDHKPVLAIVRLDTQG